MNLNYFFDVNIKKIKNSYISFQKIFFFKYNPYYALLIFLPALKKVGSKKNLPNEIYLLLLKLINLDLSCYK